jgi:hypothetical protein
MVLYTIKQNPAGPWSIQRMGSSLFDDLQLAAAIRLARAVARDEHLRNGLAIRVELHDAAHVILLGNFDPNCSRSVAA